MAELFSKLGIDWKLLIANAITFFLVLWLLRKFAYRPLMDVMDKRRAKIDDGLDKAKQAKIELEYIATEKQKVLAAARTESLQLIQSAQKDAEARKQELMAKAETEATALVAKTRQQLDREKQQMLDQAKGELADLVVAATGKVIAAQLDDKLQRKLAEQAIQEVAK
jgi:F-type H+-transporting ATPase subunit b